MTGKGKPLCETYCFAKIVNAAAVETPRFFETLSISFLKDSSNRIVTDAVISRPFVDESLTFRMTLVNIGILLA